MKKAMPKVPVVRAKTYEAAKAPAKAVAQGPELYPGFFAAADAFAAANSTPEAAHRTLVQMGIVDSRGRLTPAYSSKTRGSKTRVVRKARAGGR